MIVTVCTKHFIDTHNNMPGGGIEICRGHAIFQQRKQALKECEAFLTAGQALS